MVTDVAEVWPLLKEDINALIRSHRSLAHALHQIKAAGDFSELQCSRLAIDDFVSLAAVRDAFHSVVMEIVTKALEEDSDAVHHSSKDS